MEKLILIGAGGHAKSVVDAISLNTYKLCGFIDENKTGYHMGLPILGRSIEEVTDYRNFSYFVAIGDVRVRKKWFEHIKMLGLHTINIIDTTAVVSKWATIGTGNFIGKLAVINAGSVIGDNNVINTKALVEHECRIGNHTHISTNATVNGNVVVGDGVFMGSTSVCNGQLSIGEYAVIGSGSVMIRDVEPYTTVVGAPARVIKRRKPDD